MHRFIPLAFLSVIAGPATAQPSNQRFDVRGFSSVELASSDAVHIVCGKAFAVKAEGDQRAVASLVIDVHDGVLRISHVPGPRFNQSAVVTVTMPKLRALSLLGSGAIDAGAVDGEDLSAQLSGSGRILLSDLSARQVRLVLDGSGSITASGRAGRVAIDLGGSGKVEASSLATAVLSVDLAGSGSVSAAASSAATIRADGSGNVRVSGHSTCAISKSGNARVICG